MKLVVLIVFAITAGILYYFFREKITLEYLASIESDLVEFKKTNILLTLLIAFVIYAGITSFPLPFATVLSLAYAWFFGFAQALILISFASTTGATLAFLMSRYLLRDSIQNRFGKWLKTFNEAFERDGALYLLSLRMIAGVPFFVINSVMGLTPIRTRTFWWVSQLGMLPGTAVYVFAGSQIPSLTELAENGIPANPWLLVAFALLGIFPLLVKLTAGAIKKRLNTKKSIAE